MDNFFIKLALIKRDRGSIYFGEIIFIFIFLNFYSIYLDEQLLKWIIIMKNRDDILIKDDTFLKIMNIIDHSHYKLHMLVNK
jgi:hypothetical protein